MIHSYDKLIFAYMVQLRRIISCVDIPVDRNLLIVDDFKKMKEVNLISIIQNLD